MISIGNPEPLIEGQRPSSPSVEILIPFKEVWVVAVLLSTILLVAYSNVIFQGRSLVYSNNQNPLDSSHSAESYGPEFVPHEVWQQQNLLLTANFHDPWGALGQWEPGGEFLRKGLAKGEWPLWDPYVGAGAPAMENLTSTFFFPPYFLMVSLGNTVFLKNSYFLLLLLAAGLFTYLFSRKHDLSREASFFAAVTYMLGGGISQEVGSFGAQVASCLPFILYMTRQFLDRPTVRRTAALAISFAASSLTGIPPMLIPIFGFTAFYGICMILSTRCIAFPDMNRWRLVALFGIAVGLSLGLVAFYFLPVFHLLTDLPRHVGEYYRGFGLASLPPIGLYQLISPTLLDGFIVFTDPAMKGLIQPWQILPYVGIVPILAALLGSRATRAGKGPLLMVALWAAALLTLKLVGAQPVHWIGLLPGLNNLRWVPYAGILFNCLFALLGALGLESLLNGKVTPARAGTALFSGLVILLSLRQVAEGHGLRQQPHATRWLSDWTFLFVLTLSFTILVFVGSLIRSNRVGAKIIVLLTIGICLIEGVSNTTYPRQKSWDVWRHPVPYVEKLIEDAGSARVFAGGGTLHANATSAYEISGINSLLPFNSYRMFQLYRQYFSPDIHLFLDFAKQLPPESVLDHANIEFLVIPDFQGELIRELDQRGHEVWFRHGSVRIYRRPTLPRYYFSSAYRLVEPMAALEAVGSPGAEREIILERRPTFPSLPNLAGESKVEVRQLGRNGYTLEVSSPRSGLVYCSESFYRGWTAHVNGKRAKILRANFAFRAVEVPAGRVVLELSYWPPGLTWGLIITLISMILAFAGMWWNRPG